MLEYASTGILILDFFNPFLTNGFSHHYHLGEFTFIFRGVGVIFIFHLNF